MPSGKDFMWIAVGIVIGWFVIPHLLARKTAPATTAGY